MRNDTHALFIKPMISPVRASLRLAVVLVCCGLMVSCAATQDASTPTTSGNNTGPRDLGGGPMNGSADRSNTPASVSAATPAVASDRSASARPGPQIPEGARFTISCIDFAGPDHVQRASRMRDQLVHTSGLRDWYVVHNADAQRSVLYHGYYKAIEAGPDADRATRAEAERARSDKQKLDALTTADGKRLLTATLFMPLDAPDPDGPSEWNLARANGYWTLQIAAYTGGPERKRLAVESVKEARAMGIEAYYYHGPSVSSVCIGAWPMEAAVVLGEGSTQPRTDRVSDSVVVSTIPIAGDDAVSEVNTRQGRTRLVQMQIDIRDPRLLNTYQQYPQHFTNGEADGVRAVDRATGREVIRPRPSLLVRIPQNAGMIGTSTPSPVDPRFGQPMNNDLGRRLGEIAR
jgi:hypothetical protein